ncbi:MAG: TPM domain-containing protein [Candidatus Obscuribacter sp.]|nr:TPM domain-containing protein [Candidatus Obscuribacter sp.]MBK9774333.1 TPM domain-containing protein [Candidatus Obscuribacter sp.]MDQ5967626.1 hypothetical protein [Cyanobacteriota bacterium erpe_2018_sw_39hr_WHONDRS-SW48-000098_B_bin.30]
MKNQDWPQGVPLKPPSETVLDLAGVLTTDDRQTIDTEAKGMHYHARVVILPRGYKDNDDLLALSDQIAYKWGIKGAPTDRLLMLVDYSNHKVRIVRGDKLTDAGVDTNFVRGTVIPRSFIPKARETDIKGAISDSLTAIEDRYQSGTVVGRSTIASGAQHAPRGIESTIGEREQNLAYLKAHGSESQTPVPQSKGPSPLAGSAMIVVIIVFIAFFTTIFLTINRNRKAKQKVLTNTLEGKLNELYINADQLGQASEYIKPDENKELAYRIGVFFQKLSTLDSAKEEVDKLAKNGKSSANIDGLIKCLQMADALLSESQHLSTQVNAITGGIDSQAEARALVDKHDKEQKLLSAQKQESASDSEGENPGHILKVPQGEQAEKMPARLFGTSRYYQPSWSTMDEYAHPIVVQSNGGLTNLMFMLNQMETNRRLDDLAMHQYAIPPANSYYQDQSIFGGGSSSYDSGSDSGSWGSSDSGGSWDSGSDSGSWSDSGSSDSGSDGGSW